VKKQREKKEIGKDRAKDSEDFVMNDGSDICSPADWPIYEDLCGYGDEAPAVAPVATKK